MTAQDSLSVPNLDRVTSVNHLIDEVIHCSDLIENCREKLDFDLASYSARTVRIPSLCQTWTA